MMTREAGWSYAKSPPSRQEPISAALLADGGRHADSQLTATK